MMKFRYPLHIQLHLLILGSSLLLNLPGMAQDTTAIYFLTGQYKIKEKQAEVLKNLPVDYDMSQVDSIRFIGMADSVGSLRSNLRLSEKRAKSAAKYCRSLIDEEITFSTQALGEKKGHRTHRSRRVDVVLYSTPDTTDTVIKEEEPGLCQYVAYGFMYHSHVREVKKRGTPLMVIETEPLFFDGNKPADLYSGHVNDSGSVHHYKVKWKRKTTGKDWYRHKRFVATIPKVDYDQFKLFRKYEPPCNRCHFDDSTGVAPTESVDCLKKDAFLMRNMQVKKIPFKRWTMKVRVPREYVLERAEYYYFSRNVRKTQKLQWTAKKGKRNRRFLYTELDRYKLDNRKPDRGRRLNTYLPNIKRKMKCCPQPAKPDDPPLLCGGTGGFNRVDIFSVEAEAGYIYQTALHLPYVAMGIRRSGQVGQAALMAGLYGDLGIYTSLRLQLHLLSFIPSDINPTSSWETPTQITAQRYWNLFAGLELKGRAKPDGKSFLENNIHLGLSSIDPFNTPSIPRLFMQFGMGRDHLKEIADDWYPYVHIGIDIRLVDISRINWIGRNR